jgi:hypothetical protein
MLELWLLVYGEVQCRRFLGWTIIRRMGDVLGINTRKTTLTAMRLCREVQYPRRTIEGSSAGTIPTTRVSSRTSHIRIPRRELACVSPAHRTSRYARIRALTYKHDSTANKGFCQDRNVSIYVIIQRISRFAGPVGAIYPSASLCETVVARLSLY